MVTIVQFSFINKNVQNEKGGASQRWLRAVVSKIGCIVTPITSDINLCYKCNHNENILQPINNRFTQ